jgi:hypothetical protein
MSAATRALKYGGLATLPLPEPKMNTHGGVGVDKNELLQFLLPSGFFHSKSTARLYIFAECGPTLVKVREGWMSLRAGYKGMHVVTEQELEDMIHEMIREDILRVYVGNAVLTPTEQEEVISQVSFGFILWRLVEWRPSVGGVCRAPPTLTPLISAANLARTRTRERKHTLLQSCPPCIHRGSLRRATRSRQGGVGRRHTHVCARAHTHTHTRTHSE